MKASLSPSRIADLARRFQPDRPDIVIAERDTVIRVCGLLKELRALFDSYPTVSKLSHKEVGALRDQFVALADSISDLQSEWFSRTLTTSPNFMQGMTVLLMRELSQGFRVERRGEDRACAFGVIRWLASDLVERLTVADCDWLAFVEADGPRSEFTPKICQQRWRNIRQEALSLPWPDLDDMELHVSIEAALAIEVWENAPPPDPARQDTDQWEKENRYGEWWNSRKTPRDLDIAFTYAIAMLRAVADLRVAVVYRRSLRKRFGETVTVHDSMPGEAREEPVMDMGVVSLLHLEQLRRRSESLLSVLTPELNAVSDGVIRFSDHAAANAHALVLKVVNKLFKDIDAAYGGRLFDGSSIRTEDSHAEKALPFDFDEYREKREAVEQLILNRPEIPSDEVAYIVARIEREHSLAVAQRFEASAQYPVALGGSDADLGARDDELWLRIADAEVLSGVNRGTISRAAEAGKIKTNGKAKDELRLVRVDFVRWVLDRAKRPEPRESDAHVKRLLREAGGDD